MELLIAIRNTISSPGVISVKSKTKQAFVDLLPKLVKIDSVPSDEVKAQKQASLSLEVLSFCIKKHDSVEDLMNPGGVIEHLIDIIASPNNQYMLAEDLTLCLQTIADHPKSDVESHLWNSGLLGLLMKNIPALQAK